MSDKIKFDYVIPESKSEITVDEWVQFNKIHTVDVDPEFLQKRMLEIFCKVPSEYSTKLAQVRVNDMLNRLTILFSQNSDLKQRFTFKNIEWGLIPDFSKHITTGELIDLDSYLESGDYTRLLSILYRPIIKSYKDSYDIEPYEGSHELFKTLPYDILDGVLVFFWTLFNQLGKATLKYTKKVMEKEKDLILVEKVNSLLNGEDIQSLFT